MSVVIALAGNPNSGKTTLFNALTGSNQYVGNWPGVTVERKEARFALGEADATLVDLPGVYSLSPYSIEENITRHFIAQHAPDVVLNIVDATNIERNLYLTTQLAELGIPMVIALNMIDVTRKRGDIIQLKKLGEALGCEVVETSALKGIGTMEAATKAAQLGRGGARREAPHVFAGSVEHAIAHIEDLLTKLGAPVAAMDIMTTKVDKAIRNGANRAMNCDIANVNKILEAATEQQSAIEALAKSGQLDRLPEKLQQTARLRLEHPELSLAQLAELCDPPVSKSCMNHRMRKLNEEAKKLL